MNIYVSRGGHFFNQYYLLPIFTIFFTQNQIMCKLLYSYDDVYMHEKIRLALSKQTCILFLFIFFFTVMISVGLFPWNLVAVKPYHRQPVRGRRWDLGETQSARIWVQHQPKASTPQLPVTGRAPELTHMEPVGKTLIFSTQKGKDWLREEHPGTSISHSATKSVLGTWHLINLRGPHFLLTQVDLHLWQESAYDMKYGN